VVARLALDQRRQAEAGVLLDELLGLTGDEGGFPHFRWIVDSAWLARDLGRLETWWERARHEPASRYLEIGEAVARGEYEAAAELLAAKGHATEAAYAWLRAGEAAGASGRRAEAERCAGPALEFHRRVGASAYVRRGEALSARSA
jgi:hypothetical protein